MTGFNIRELAATRKTDKENDRTLQEFFESAYPSIPADEINSILKQNRHNWNAVWFFSGQPNDHHEYTDEIIRQARGIKENIVSLVLLGTSSSIKFIYELKEYADDFSFTASYTLENEKVIFILYFLKE